ncbi:MAG: FCD domain-containing protein [Qipengyuania sp.]|nr:FCD domain-containing protein [Qipengyuania sp.]
MRVVDLDVSELSDLMDLVAVLQGLIARLAASHATSPRLSALEALIDRMDAIVAAKGPMNEQLRLPFEAGAAFREACGSRRAASIMTRVGRLAYRQHRHLLGAELSWRREAVTNSRRLHEMLSRGNPTASDRQAHIMVEHSKRNILKSLEQSGRRLLPLPTCMESLAADV